jgi:sigma-B regulation protein RsbU (phosphoserine phosphatase)
MIEAPIHENDAERVASLRALQLLDTPPEERFDRITRLLQHMFKVPMAYLSLVDEERQWFKSACGMNRSQTPRSVSFCGHAIHSDAPLVVSDAARDSRFSDNPLVTGDPGIRFYAGFPLKGPGGHNVGTLCIADRRPRHLESADVRMLREMAQIVESELNLVETVELQRELLTVREQAAEANRQKAEYLSQLVESQKSLVRELNQAAEYVRSLLPAPLEGAVQTRWHFAPSSQLGGDCFGYDWLDGDRFAVYLLDVSGHGVGAALLAVSVMNALRAQALPHADFSDPASVLARLNETFTMEQQNGKYFTIWYGVFDRRNRRLTYAAAGHPPALLLPADGNGQTGGMELGTPNFAIGMVAGAAFDTSSVSLHPTARMYIYSDGAYEIHRSDGTLMTREELVLILASCRGPRAPVELYESIRLSAKSEALQDDFSLLEVAFR